jgi:hypothetical protein
MNTLLLHSFALFGMYALLLFGPRRQVYAGTAEESENRLPFLLLAIPFATGYLWWFVVGETL